MRVCTCFTAVRLKGYLKLSVPTILKSFPHCKIFFLLLLSKPKICCSNPPGILLPKCPSRRYIAPGFIEFLLIRMPLFRMMTHFVLLTISFMLASNSCKCSHTASADPTQSNCLAPWRPGSRSCTCSRLASQLLTLQSAQRGQSRARVGKLGSHYQTKQWGNFSLALCRGIL